ncbi:hypothetical protein ARMSODRAFT_1026635, partial [Armillaria solidipes]
MILIQVLITTDALKVGNDIPNAADVIILNPKDPNDIKQKEGRSGRRPGLVSNPGPWCIVYVTDAMLKRAKVLDGCNSQGGQKGRSKRENACMDDDQGTMTVEMAHLLLAPCYLDEFDIQYENPIEDPPCTCE